MAFQMVESISRKHQEAFLRIDTFVTISALYEVAESILKISAAYYQIVIDLYANTDYKSAHSMAVQLYDHARELQLLGNKVYNIGLEMKNETCSNP